jgi:hypothetical protein
MAENYKYDVAFSFLIIDEPIGATSRQGSRFYSDEELADWIAHVAGEGLRHQLVRLSLPPNIHRCQSADIAVETKCRASFYVTLTLPIQPKKVEGPSANG